MEISGSSVGRALASPDAAGLARAAGVCAPYLRQALSAGAPYCLAERLARITGRPLQAFLGGEPGGEVARRRSRERRRARAVRQARGADR
jgi:hypothetical protein